MITQQDIEAAIAECQGKRNPDASTCIKLAAFYTIRNELFPKETSHAETGYSYAVGPEKPDNGLVNAVGESEFLHKIDGKRQEDVWPVLDELMLTIKNLYPRMYNAVLARL